MATRQEAQDEAKRLVVADGYSYAQAATATGIPLSTIQKWAAAEAWQKQRETSMSYGATVRAMKANVLAQLVTMSADPASDKNQLAQLSHAWRNLESAYPEHRYDKKADPKVRLDVAAEVIEKLVAYLGKHDRNALTAVQPHIAPFAQEWEANAAA